MPKLANFTHDGEAIRLTGHLDDNDKPVYLVELLHEYDGRTLTLEELLSFAKALQKDASEWGGLLCRFPEETFTNPIIASFENAWGGEAHDQAQGCDASRGDAE